MKTKQNKPQPNRPRWITPKRTKPTTATADYLDGLPVGEVLAVPVRFGAESATVPLSVEKVSPGKYAVHTRRGFPARLLIGAQVVRRVRRDVAEVTA